MSFNSKIHKTVWEYLYVKLSPELLKFIKTKIGDSDNARDILHDSFLEIMTRYKHISSEKELQSLLFAISRNIAADLCKEKTNTVPFEMVSDYSHASHNENEKDLEEYIYSIVSEQIMALKPMSRKILIKSVLYKMSHKHIGTELGITTKQSSYYLNSTKRLLINNIRKLVKNKFK